MRNLSGVALSKICSSNRCPWTCLHGTFTQNLIERNITRRLISDISLTRCLCLALIRFVPHLVTAGARRIELTMTSSRIPFYRVQGNHYECARQLGSIAQPAIQRRIEEDDDCLPKIFAFCATKYGHQLLDEFEQIIRSHYPWYWDEIRGLADGATLPIEQILMLNCINEAHTASLLWNEKENNSKDEPTIVKQKGEQGCTTVLLNRTDTNTFDLLHNEDHGKALLNASYIVEADIQSSVYNEGQRNSPQEKFIAYCYAGSLPGMLLAQR
jgi:hypothetical protein